MSGPAPSSPLRPDANAGKVAFISGGGTGLGRATALELALSGAKVAICGRREEPLRETARLVEQLGGECHVEAMDVRETEQVERGVDAVLERFGAIDVLVNNAGGQFVARAEDISDNGWRAVMRLNLDAVWTMTRTVAVRSMLPRESGLVVFVGFSPGRGIEGFAHSCASRAAVSNLASQLALEWAQRGVRTVCLGVGNFQTEGMDGYEPDAVEHWTNAIPMGRLGHAEEVAQVIGFLTSSGGSYITGTTIYVDGGLDAAGLGWRTDR